MEATELRIGNIVTVKTHAKFEKTLFTVAAVDDPVVRLEQDGVGHSHNISVCFMEPVLITSDILKKAGFSESSPDCYELCYSTPGMQDTVTFRVMKHDNGWWFILCGRNDQKPRRILNIGTYKYIHQLQNTWYQLSQAELKINL